MGVRHERPPEPALRLDRTAEPPRAAVLLLHGGRADGVEPPPVWNPPGARMRPFARAIARATAEHDIVLGTVRYRHRGWNGTRADAAHDALRALDELEFLTGPVPVVLVGHSMGGRAALRAASHPLVEAVVGLAPWCPEGEPVEHLADRRVVLVHGDRDRVTDPEDSWELAARARAAGAESCALRIPGGDHAMLRGARAWHALTTRLVTGLLRLGPLPPTVADSFDDLGPIDVRTPEGDRTPGGNRTSEGDRTPEGERPPLAG
ncbi:alpha/beta fold hydrolase [Streptomyces sp. NPDC005408]|uniref:alpha/beta hydrolase n=1 Tax=Streptomyces sp. NPDC005408 TaxID=3155341 RepID=UPI0033A9513E